MKSGAESNNNSSYLILKEFYIKRKKRGRDLSGTLSGGVLCSVYDKNSLALASQQLSTEIASTLTLELFF